MKLILAAAVLASMIAPVAAVAQPTAAPAFEDILGLDGLFDRRSGHCPSGKGVAREGSICGGV